ncbi:MAG: phosphate ABC transporter permease subunit PstC, partial [Planctomycetota bacterium]|nr:phosphate ABC transporter permease subunit PstC [Planctomycetota bacterium]
GVLTAAIPLEGMALNRAGYFVASPTQTVFGLKPDVQTDIHLEDDDNLTVLLVRGLSAAEGADLDADNDGELDRDPWTEVVDSIALIKTEQPDEQNGASHVYSEVRLGPISETYLPTHVLRHPNTAAWESGSGPSTHVTFGEFITGREWNPLLGAEKHFGIWPLIAGTALVAGIAMCIAIPFGLITAIFLSEYAPRRLRAFLKPALEVLAGIPTVVYGFFALTFITPLLRNFNGLLPEALEFGPYNAMSAGIAVGIMCLPIVSSLSEDALQAVPRSLREGAFALGGTRFDVSVKVVTPAALSGVMAAFLLAIARAVGETMIVALAAGGTPRLTINPAAEVQTMTAYMVQIFLGDASNFGPEYLSAYTVGATLFVITLILTLIGGRILKRFREVYE